jgi:hypothetical protein
MEGTPQYQTQISKPQTHHRNHQTITDLKS